MSAKIFSCHHELDYFSFVSQIVLLYPEAVSRVHVLKTYISSEEANLLSLVNDDKFLVMFFDLKSIFFK